MTDNLADKILDESKIYTKEGLLEVIDALPLAIAVIDSNRAKAYEEQKSMRQELVRWIESCETRHMHELYSEMKRMKKEWE